MLRQSEEEWGRMRYFGARSMKETSGMAGNRRN